MDLTFDEMYETCREGVKRMVTEPERICKACGGSFRREGPPTVYDDILCVPCLGDAISRITS